MAADFFSLHYGESAWRWSAGLLAVGCASAVPALLTGLLDIGRVPEGEPLRDTFWHLGFMLLAFILFALRLVMGLNAFQPLPPTIITLAIDAAALLSLGGGGWFGGRLVYHHGVGQSGPVQSKSLS